MTYPRKYATVAALGQPLDETLDWDAMVDRVNGVTLLGVRAYPYSYLIRKNGGVYEAIDSTANLVFGGSDDANGVDGTNFADVVQACANALAASSGLIIFKDGTYLTETEITIPDKVALWGETHYGTIIKANAVINSIFSFRAVPQVELARMSLDGDGKAHYCVDAGQDTNYARETWFYQLDAKDAVDTNINCYNREVCTMNFVHTYGAQTGIDARSGSGTLDWTNVNVINASLRGAYLGGNKICWNMGGGGGTSRYHIQLGGAVGSLSIQNTWFEGGGTFLSLNDDGIDGGEANVERFLDQFSYRDAAVYIGNTNYLIDSYAHAVPARITLDNCGIAAIAGTIHFSNYRPNYLIAKNVATVSVINLYTDTCHGIHNDVFAMDDYVMYNNGNNSITTSGNAGNKSFVHGCTFAPHDIHITISNLAGVTHIVAVADDTNITVYLSSVVDQEYTFNWDAKCT
jgi:hypothetical protein